MGTGSHLAPDGKPILQECWACQEYSCKVQLPVESATLVLIGGASYQGLCILHWQKESKDSPACWRAVEQKKTAADFNFSGVVFSCPIEFHDQVENANFSGAAFHGGAD